MSSSSRSVLFADLLLLAVALVWGSSYGIVKEALLVYPVLGLIALRFALTFVLLSPALRALRGLTRGEALAVLGAGVLLLCIFVAETFGVRHTHAANAAFLISLCVVLTPLVERQIPDTAKARGLSEEAVKRDVLLAAQPTKRFVGIEEIASLATFLCSQEAASITGAVLPIDGGWTAQ